MGFFFVQLTFHFATEPDIQAYTCACAELPLAPYKPWRMKTTLAIRPEFPEFDIYRALSWIKNEADWVSLRFVQEHTHQRVVRNQRPENNSVTFDRG